MWLSLALTGVVLITLQNNVWVEQINIRTLVIKGLEYNFVDDFQTLYSYKFHVFWYVGYWVQGEK